MNWTVHFKQMGAASGDNEVASPFNPHRTLVAMGEDALCNGQFTVRNKYGESVHIRVVQETFREDINMRRVRWRFAEGSDVFDIELRHGRTSGLRKVYVNKELQERVKSMSTLFSSQATTHEFMLIGQHVTRNAKVVNASNLSNLMRCAPYYASL